MCDEHVCHRRIPFEIGTAWHRGLRWEKAPRAIHCATRLVFGQSQSHSVPSGVFYTFFAASLGLSTVLARSALDYPDRCLARSYTAYTDRCTRTEKAAERRRGRPSQRLIRHHVKRNKPNKRRASRMPHGQTNGETIHIYRAERLEDDVTATMSGALTDRTPPPRRSPTTPPHTPPSAVFTVHSTSPQCPRSRALSLPLALNTPGYTPGYTPGSSLDTSHVVI